MHKQSWSIFKMFQKLTEPQCHFFVKKLTFNPELSNFSRYKEKISRLLWWSGRKNREARSKFWNCSSPKYSWPHGRLHWQGYTTCHPGTTRGIIFGKNQILFPRKLSRRSLHMGPERWLGSNLSNHSKSGTSSWFWVQSLILNSSKLNFQLIFLRVKAS